MQPKAQQTGDEREPAVQWLIREHMQLDEPMEAAIWIRRDRNPEVWLVEVLPEFADDEHVHEPVCFNPTRDFRYPLCLIGGNLQNLLDAVKKEHELAQWLTEGKILHGEDVARQLIDAAGAQIGKHD